MVKKNKVYTLTASHIAAIAAAMAGGNKICAIKEFREATGADLKDAKDVIEGNFEQEIPVLKVGQKIKVSDKNGSWSYTGRIFETDGDNFKLVQDQVSSTRYYSDIHVGFVRHEKASSSMFRDGSYAKLEILAD